jgi:hypothetical protein
VWGFEQAWRRECRWNRAAVVHIPEASRVPGEFCFEHGPYLDEDGEPYEAAFLIRAMDYSPRPTHTVWVTVRPAELTLVVICRVSHRVVATYSWSGVPWRGSTRQIAGDMLEQVLQRIRYGTMPTFDPESEPVGWACQCGHDSMEHDRIQSRLGVDYPCQHCDCAELRPAAL